MGPAATAHFYNMFVKHCGSASDQSHPDAIILSLPSIPDRTAFIIGHSGDNPLYKLRGAAETLISLGAELLVMPCVTAHYFYDDIIKDLEIPFLHIVKETADTLHKKGIKKAGLLATRGTVESGVFHKELAVYGIDVLTPSDVMQTRLMDILYSEIKAGKPADLNSFYEITGSLTACGSEILILGCTELSLINASHNLDGYYADASEILAHRAAEICLGL